MEDKLTDDRFIDDEFFWDDAWEIFNEKFDI
jgi:hypothetical protein